VAREWVVLQYDGADVQDYWQVDYAVDGTTITNWAADPTLDQVSVSGTNMWTDSTATDLTAAAGASNSSDIVLLASSWSTNVWDGTNNFPGHEVSKVLGTTTTGTVVVPANLQDEFTAWYEVQNFAASGSLAAVSSTELTSADSRTTVWGAASSLTAAATVVVAASLF
jgi:hypothetical protein